MTRPYVLHEAPQLAHLDVLFAALRAFELQLRFEHPTMNDPWPGKSRTVRRATFVRDQIAALRREVLRYRRAVLDDLRPRTPPDDDLLSRIF